MSLKDDYSRDCWKLIAFKHCFDVNVVTKASSVATVPLICLLRAMYSRQNLHKGQVEQRMGNSIQPKKSLTLTG